MTQHVMIKDVNFGRIFCGAGAMGVYGEGYWFHYILRIFFLINFNSITLVTKTLTFHPIEGNLNNRFKPKCIKVYFGKNAILNAVGLTNPGISEALVALRNRESNFFISITSIKENPKDRLNEYRIIQNILAKNSFKSKYGIQVNFSCPNTGNKELPDISEIMKVIDILSSLNVPIMPKVAVGQLREQDIKSLEKLESCDGLCVGNSIPFNSKDKYFKNPLGEKKSPLAKYNGGAISGAPIFNSIIKEIEKFRSWKFTKHINHSGGIVSISNSSRAINVGSNSISLCSVFLLRPYLVNKIIKHFCKYSEIKNKLTTTL